MHIVSNIAYQNSSEYRHHGKMYMYSLISTKFSHRMKNVAQLCQLKQKRSSPSPIRRIRSFLKNGTMGLWFACIEAFLGGLALPLPCFCPLPCCCPLAGLDDGPDGLPGPRARGGGAFLTFLLLRGMTDDEERSSISKTKLYELV